MPVEGGVDVPVAEPVGLGGGLVMTNVSITDGITVIIVLSLLTGAEGTFTQLGRI